MSWNIRYSRYEDGMLLASATTGELLCNASGQLLASQPMSSDYAVPAGASPTYRTLTIPSAILGSAFPADVQGRSVFIAFAKDGIGWWLTTYIIFELIGGGGTFAQQTMQSGYLGNGSAPDATPRMTINAGFYVRNPGEVYRWYEHFVEILS